MSSYWAWALMLLFAAHLAGFLVLAVRRRQAYYLALVLTFSLLTASFALYLAAPAATFAGLPVYRFVRYLSWASAAASLTWTGLRLRARLRRR